MGKKLVLWLGVLTLAGGLVSVAYGFFIESQVNHYRFTGVPRAQLIKMAGVLHTFIMVGSTAFIVGMLLLFIGACIRPKPTAPNG